MLAAQPTPMMAQWHACKKQAPQCLLLFRMGDFYEAFYEDAELLAMHLDLSLTKRQNIPMAGVPFHAAENYIDRLIAKGFKVAIAEQTEDPKKAKGLVKREIVKILSPGALITSNLLVSSSHNFIISIAMVGPTIALSCLDLTTATFTAMECKTEKELLDELCRLQPKEVLLSEKLHQTLSPMWNELRLNCNCVITQLQNWEFDYKSSWDFLTRHFKVHNLDGFGLQNKGTAIIASGALLIYVHDTLQHSIGHIEKLSFRSNKDTLSLDRVTLSNLEILESKTIASQNYTLLQIIDKTLTPMGGRLLKTWLQHPLISIKEIQKRQHAIELFITQPLVLEKLREQMRAIRDLERMIIKVSTGYATAKDFVALANSLQHLPYIRKILLDLDTTSDLIREITENLVDLSELTATIYQAIVDEPPLRLGEGKTFRSGYNQELDEWLAISQNGKEWLASYQQQLRNETDIKTLKVGYNRVFGYYIEVSKGQADRMPDSFIRRQTLTNSERFISPTLKEYESKVLAAEEKILDIEQALFKDLQNHILTFSQAIQQSAHNIAQLDVLCGLTNLAIQYSYCKPEVNNENSIQIIQGRHPVIEQLHYDEPFIANDTFLDQTSESLCILTGPNMAGKSTYIRQVALIVILAQIGSYVPAKEATIGIVDKIFTRIGASDDLARGQSTFMVEMAETANILHNATEKSLIILDEIGRGTSTYDGISLAWSIAEYLATEKKAKTLFATHYFELTDLAKEHDCVENYTVSVKETKDTIVFMHKIQKGIADKSYGIHVAKLAGIPQQVLNRAKTILQTLENDKNNTPSIANTNSSKQLDMFETKETETHSKLIKEIESLSVNTLTPLDALNFLANLQIELKN